MNIITIGLTAVKSGMALAKAHAPIVFMVAGGCLLGATVLEAIKATPKYEDDKTKELSILKAAKEKGLVKMEDDKLPFWTRMKVIAKGYWKTLFLMALTLACFVAAQHVTATKLATTSAALIAAQKENREQLAKANKLFGHGSADKITDGLAKDQFNSTNQLFVDCESMQEIDSTIAAIQAGVNEVNGDLIRRLQENAYDGKQWACVNDLYDAWMIKPTRAGAERGWNISDHGTLAISFEPCFTKDHRPALMINYVVYPIETDGRYCRGRL